MKPFLALLAVILVANLLMSHPPQYVAPVVDKVTVPVTYTQQDCPGGVCPLPARQPILARKWFNNDGLSLRQHAERVHGHKVDGLTDQQVARLNDHDHDTWGSGHHRVQPVRNVQPVRRTVRFFRDRQPVRTFLRNKPVRRALGRLFCR